MNWDKVAPNRVSATFLLKWPENNLHIFLIKNNKLIDSAKALSGDVGAGGNIPLQALLTVHKKFESAVKGVAHQRFCMLAVSLCQVAQSHSGLLREVLEALEALFIQAPSALRAIAVKQSDRPAVDEDRRYQKRGAADGRGQQVVEPAPLLRLRRRVEP